MVVKSRDCMVKGDLCTKQQNFRPAQIEASADDKIELAQVMKLPFDRVENIVGERGKCQHFLLFQQFFFNPFPNKPWFLRVCCTCLFKTLS